MARERTSDIILKIAAKAADACIELAACFVNQKGLRKGDYTYGLSDSVSKNAAKSAIQRLKKNGCLEKIEKNGETLYRITEQGRNKIEKFLFDREMWDGRWRIVIYDIPELQKRDRDGLRNKLRSCRFKQLQKSVWVSPFDVLDEVEEFVTERNLQDRIWYFWANSFHNDESIIELFLHHQA